MKQKTTKNVRHAKINIAQKIWMMDYSSNVNNKSITPEDWQARFLIMWRKLLQERIQRVTSTLTVTSSVCLFRKKKMPVRHWNLSASRRIEHDSHAAAAGSPRWLWHIEISHWKRFWMQTLGFGWGNVVPGIKPKTQNDGQRSIIGAVPNLGSVAPGNDKDSHFELFENNCWTLDWHIKAPFGW